MRYLKIEENTNLLKDEISGAILNTNKTEYENYLLLKNQKEKDAIKMNQIESEVNKIRNELTEIKNLIRSIFDESK